VWAEENTRASIFEAMQRKETFAVSGPHIQVRFFGGWSYTADMLAGADWAKTGYEKGVPMGGDLPPTQAKAPTFLVWAVKDPTSGNLDRIQVVKGWTKSGQSFEKVFDVVWAGDRKPDKWTGVVPPIGSTVDLEKATYTNTIGSVELKTVWTDPEFDPSLHAFYYARVLEIPTPRWTTIQAAKLGIAPTDVVAATLQERAWSSPIGYTPSAEAAKAAKRGATVADAKPLTSDEPGYVTQRFPAGQGHFQVRYVGRDKTLPSLTSDAAESTYLDETRTYDIANGKIVTDLAGTPIEIAVYKVGDKYVAARSNEFGYANYAMVPAEPVLSPLGAAPSKAAPK